MYFPNARYFQILYNSTPQQLSIFRNFKDISISKLQSIFLYPTKVLHDLQFFQILLTSTYFLLQNTFEDFSMIIPYFQRAFKYNSTIQVQYQLSLLYTGNYWPAPLHLHFMASTSIPAFLHQHLYSGISSPALRAGISSPALLHRLFFISTSTVHQYNGTSSIQQVAVLQAWQWYVHGRTSLGESLARCWFYGLLAPLPRLLRSGATVAEQHASEGR